MINAHIKQEIKSVFVSNNCVLFGSFKINDSHMFSVIVDIQGRLFHIKVCKYICL